MKTYSEALTRLAAVITQFNKRNVVLYMFGIMEKTDRTFVVIALELSEMATTEKHNLECNKACEVTEDGIIGCQLCNQVFHDPAARVWKVAV